MIDNDSLGAVLARAVTDEPPLRGGSDEVFAAATALRRRRRCWTAVAGVATVLVTAGVVVTVGALTRAPASVSPPATAVTAPVSKDPTPPPPDRVTATERVRLYYVDAAKVARQLRSMLPPGTYQVTHQEASTNANVRYRDAHGTTDIEIVVSPNQSFLWRAQAPAPNAADIFDCGHYRADNPSTTYCSTATLPGGALMMRTTGRNEGSGIGVAWSVVVLYPSGLYLRLDTYNVPDPKYGQVSRSEPALSLDQLETIITDPIWIELGKPTGSTCCVVNALR